MYSASHHVGTVPVYAGDDDLLRTQLPEPNAAIFFSDFGLNVTLLANYLKYLFTNETAYELHRQWRKDFDFSKWRHTHLVTPSWRCRFRRKDIIITSRAVVTF